MNRLGFRKAQSDWLMKARYDGFQWFFRQWNKQAIEPVSLDQAVYSLDLHCIFRRKIDCEVGVQVSVAAPVHGCVRSGLMLLAGVFPRGVKGGRKDGIKLSSKVYAFWDPDS